MRNRSAVFFAVGVAFIVLGSAGAGSRRAFLVVGVAFIIIGLVRARRARGGN